MRALINTVILLLVLPPQFRAITISTNHDKGIDPPLEEPQELLVPEVGDNNTTQQLGSGERQRRLIPYMTFYLTRNFNRPQHQLHQQNQHDQQNQRYQPVPQKILVQAYQPTYQPKYIEPASVLYQPKIRYTPFLEANKVPGGFTPMRGPQPIRVQVLNPQKEPNYSTIFDKLLQLKQLQTTGHNIQPEYQPPKLSIAQYYTRTPRPATKFIVENYRPETRYKPTNPPTKTFIHTYTPANIDISSDNKIQNYENFESLKTYQIPAPVPESHENQNTDQKHYQIIAPNYQPQSEKDNYQPVQQDYQQDQIQTYETNPDYRQNQNYKQIKTYQTIPSDYQPEKEVPQNSKEEQYEVTPKIYATPVKHYQPELQEYQNSNEYQPEKTGPINTYRIPQDHHDSNEYQPEKQVPIKTYQIPSDQQNSNEYQTEKQVSIKTYQTPSSQQQNPNEYQPEKQVPIKTYQTPQDYQQNPIEYQTEKQIPIKTYQAAQDEETYEIQYQTPEYQTTSRPKEKYTPIIVRPVYRPVAPKLYRPIYQKTPLAPVVRPPLENPNSLSVILKQLQDSNTLPRTLTPDNIDNSIKTLVHILNALKQTEKFQKPIIVTEHPGPEDEGDYEDDDDRPQTVSQSFPANTPEGGTPGKPGIDYPAYSIIPQTTFNCKEQRYKGFFGDPDTSCQVWHYCDLNGGQASFLCPNGTIFSQVALTCDWWYNVKCATTTQLYVLNERLYKYILPFTPKFPEDYSGPLVDRYLALKFQEMEEKMKKQKKGKTEKSNDSDDVVPDSDGNKLETIETETESSEQQRYEHTTHSSQEVVE